MLENPVQYQSYRKIWMAYSGGMDSSVLLHLFSEVRKANPSLLLEAVHIHHGLSPHADAWLMHCQKQCAELNIPLKIIPVRVEARADLGLEAAARAARYRALSELLQENEVMLTAHHLNDQAETFLLQLLRGAGPKGLASMPFKKPLGKGVLCRPLLKLSRIELEQYARSYALQWIEDESNEQEALSRNFLRHAVLKAVQKKWPSALKLMARSAEHCAEASDLLDELGSQDLIRLKTEDPFQLNLQALKKLSEARQRNVLRYWFKSLNFPVPEARQLHELMQHLVNAKEDAQPRVCWGDIECRRFNHRLYVMPQALSEKPKKSFAWKEEAAELLQWVGAEKYSAIEQAVRQLSLKVGDQVSIRFRQGGERCAVPGRVGTHTLKKLLQEWKISPWERAQWPLIYVNEVLAAIVSPDLV